MAGSQEKHLTLNLKVWRQKDAQTPGKLVDYKLTNISTEMSFLEMFDVLNQQLIKAGEDPVAFDHDCREGICGSCNMVINGDPHGPQKGTTTCQLHMRHFENNATIVVEPFRAKAFPMVKDLVVDRSGFDRIIAAGGYVSVNTGNAQDANNLLIPKQNADLAMDAAACIGCGACVAACKNASAMLFVSAKVSHLTLLPQGKVEADRRVLNMVTQMDEEGFGNCSNTGACEATCPKEIKLENIARMHREFGKASLRSRE
ncbi:MAG: succinate dehydrogenase/fumarate reductase iron-sulfur subunit [Bdellovibrionales bacterium]|nr:succinate dehydrogenase/fumarate reductase iron-sulfur subunit [Bdellovibrionales bacterium]